MALENLIYARAAINIVRNVMQIKAANRASDGIDQQQFDAALQVKNGIEDELSAGIADESLLALVANAKAAVRTRIGNCAWMAALAAAYLAREGHFPLHVMSFYGGDELTPPQAAMPVTGAAVVSNAHTFRLLPGRTGSGGNADYQKIDKFEPDHAVCVLGPVTGPAAALVWGADSVICDPWARRAYFASELAEETRLLARVTGGFSAMTRDASLPGPQSWNAAWNVIIGLP